ncbi:restriction endonuclease subunit S [uncultured Thiodictyon sp.]|jgi:type I restriction enzyme S subunit|uniref:restriction endonuclease subunit S n=1 Tax=uncultured Thiodictyon sp. TaxID=1846217 RepID=UPI0025FB3360|nr:restriction endonuclease subunit S [uncultured Thiodictyon sp.]
MNTELKPGYKQTEVGAIPVDWYVDSIVNVAAITTGDKNTQDRIADGIYPFFVRSSTIERINSYTFDGEAVLTAGDGVGTGKIFHYVKEKFDFHQRVYKISNFCDRLDGYYFYLYFSSNFYPRIMQMTAKSSVDSIRREMIANMRIPLPPPTEQRAIAAALSDVEALVTKLDALISKKRDLKQAAMQQLLTGTTRLPGFAGPWVVTPFDKLFSFSGGLSASRDQLSDSGYCYLHYGDIHKSTRTFIDVEKEYSEIPKLDVRLSNVNVSSLLRDGDIVFVDASEDDEGTSRHLVVANRGNIPYISGLHTLVAKSRDERLDNNFKRFCFQTQSVKDQFRFFAVGTKVSGINKSTIRKVELEFPTMLEEQTAIATILSDMDAEITAIEARRDKTRELKQGMMQELLTGRIRLVGGLDCEPTATQEPPR